MTHEQLVEKVARAICDDDYKDGDFGMTGVDAWETPDARDVYIDRARAAIAAVYEAMREPSAKMVDGMASNIRGAGFSGDSYLLARVCHVAMLEASPLKGE